MRTMTNFGACTALLSLSAAATLAMSTDSPMMTHASPNQGLDGLPDPMNLGGSGISIPDDARGHVVTEIKTATINGGGGFSASGSGNDTTDGSTGTDVGDGGSSGIDRADASNETLAGGAHLQSA